MGDRGQGQGGKDSRRAAFEVDKLGEKWILWSIYTLEIEMIEPADGVDGGVREMEEAKVTPGFFTYSVEWGEGVVMTLRRGKTGEEQLVWEVRV